MKDIPGYVRLAQKVKLHYWERCWAKSRAWVGPQAVRDQTGTAIADAEEAVAFLRRHWSAVFSSRDDWKYDGCFDRFIPRIAGQPDLACSRA
eukprot:10078387-Alexandrium_andersonii.AAC.1